MIDNVVTKTDVIEAIETIFPGKGADMIQGWAKEYVEEGMQKGLEKGMLHDAREMVLEALEAKHSSEVPPDIHKMVQGVNNRIVLKKLLRSAIQSKDIEAFRKSIRMLTQGEPSGES